MDGGTRAGVKVDTGIRVEKVGPYLGAEITGIDLGKPLDMETVDLLRDQLLEHQVLVFRDQDISVEAQLDFGRNFGELSVHPLAPNDETTPELIVFDNDADHPAFLTDNWHSDESFREVPPLGTILRAIELPPVGGDTLFCSMTAAYEGLSDWVKVAIEGMEAVHDLKLFRNAIPDTPEGREQDLRLSRDFPKVSHPVVREHPETGERVLFVNPHYTLNIKGLPELESQALLSILYHQAEIPEYQVRIKWAPNTVVFWDNRATQHYAPHDYTHRRHMHRITVKGCKPFAPGKRPL